MCLTVRSLPHVEHKSSSVRVMKYLWVSHVCPTRSQFKITSWRLYNGKDDHGRIVDFISLSLVCSVDDECCIWFKIYMWVDCFISWNELISRWYKIIITWFSYEYLMSISYGLYLNKKKIFDLIFFYNKTSWITHRCRV
jgi:hypothetical protein